MDRIGPVDQPTHKGRPVSTNEDSEATPAAPGAPQCQYPGCTRTVPIRLTGSGRQTRYCGEIVLGVRHDRSNAQTRRLQLARLGVDAETAVSEPVSVARATATDLVGRLETAIREQGTMVTSVLSALSTMDSPEQAAAQVAATSETARAEIATARAEQAAAQRRAEQAEATTTQALADAQDADAEAGAARADADAARAAAAVAETARDEALQELAGTRTQLATQTETTRQQTDRAERAEHRITQLDGELTSARADLAQSRSDAAAAAIAAQTRAGVDADTITGLRADLADATRISETLRAGLAEQTETTRQQTLRADQAEQTAARLEHDLAGEQARHATTTSQLTALTADLADIRHQAATAAAVAQAQAAAAAAAITALRDDLTQARATADAARADLEQTRTTAAIEAALARSRSDDQAATIARLQANQQQ
jgi:hypothetical protein